MILRPSPARLPACLVLAGLTGLGGPARAIVLPPGFTDELLAGGLNPTTMAFAPDGRLFLNEKDGRVRVFKGASLLERPFATVVTDPFNERGLLGIAFDPDFPSNRHVYVLYTTKGAPVRHRISRFTADGDVAAGPETPIFEIDGVSDNGNHNGGTIAFGPDGKLYVSLGNNAVGSTSQSLGSLYGKLLRINPDGSIPADNPFAASAEGRLKAVWALGFRNAYTFAIQSGTGRVFMNDVGGSAFEEVTAVERGDNGGFPAVEGNSGTAPARPGSYRAPLFTWSHTGNACAITGGAFFQPSKSTFPPEFTGRYLAADYCGGWIKWGDPAKGGALADFASGIPGPVNLQAGPDGNLYYLSRGGSRGGSAANTGTRLGELHRIRGPRVPVATGSAGPRGVEIEGFLASSGSGEGVLLRWRADAREAEITDVAGRRVRLLRRPAGEGVERIRLPAGAYRIRFR